MQGNVGQPDQKKTACGAAVVDKVSGGVMRGSNAAGVWRREKKKEKREEGRKVRGSQGQKVRRMKKEEIGRAHV